MIYDAAASAWTGAVMAVFVLPPVMVARRLIRGSW